MRIFACYMILAAVALRSQLDLEGNNTGGTFLMLLAPYALLLATEPWLLKQIRPEDRPGRRWIGAIYILIQMGLVMAMLVVPPRNDTFLALFIPLTLQAFIFFGRRIAILWICSFPLTTIPWLVEEPEFNNVVMVFVFIGMCFLVGIYADLFEKAEAARRENLRLTGELEDTNQRLQEYASQVEELAAERERYSLARELHDSVTQTVFSMNLTTQTARLVLGKDVSLVNAQLERLQELAGSAMGEIQKLEAQLKPGPVMEGDFTVAIKRMIAERRMLDGLQVQLESEGRKHFPEPVSAALLSIVGEALTNVAKHAGTHQATVRLCLAGNPAYIEVEDQGAGFDPGAALGQTGHLGLAEMAERAGEIGWRLSIDAHPGSGTRIRLEA